MSIGPIPTSLREIMRRAMPPPPKGLDIDFSGPAGEESLAPAGGVTWQVFKNPIGLFIGGISAVILELAEPRVRSGVWDHTSFRTDPLARMQRTGIAAMVTVYGPRRTAEKMIAGIGRMHARVQGTTPDGVAYRADDPELLDWVQATASFGFLEAYCRFVRPLGAADRDAFYKEGSQAARLYGALAAPSSCAAMDELMQAMGPKLERSEIVFEFLEILHRTPIFPWPLGGVQSMLIRAAVEITPGWVRDRLGLDASFGLGAIEPSIIRSLGVLADYVVLPGSPPADACKRLGLPQSCLNQH